VATRRSVICFPSLSAAGAGWLAVAEVGSGEGSALHFEFTDDDFEDGHKHFRFADGGVDLSGDFKERLEAGDLGLQADGFRGGVRDGFAGLEWVAV
jgi:hypothetical protein